MRCLQICFFRGRRQWAQPSRMCILAPAPSPSPSPKCVFWGLPLWRGGRSRKSSWRPGGSSSWLTGTFLGSKYSGNSSLGVLGGRGPSGVSWQSLGRTLRVLSGFLAVSFRIFGLPAGFQPHSTPALAPALRSHQCIDSPLRGGEYTCFYFINLCCRARRDCDES